MSSIATRNGRLSGDRVPCRSCGAPMVFVETTNGRRMPLEPEPSPEGTVAIDEDGYAVATRRGGALPANVPAGAPRYVPHHARCPQGRDWQRRR
jgi:hypothetical protein